MMNFENVNAFGRPNMGFNGLVLHMNGLLILKWKTTADKRTCLSAIP